MSKLKQNGKSLIIALLTVLAALLAGCFGSSGSGGDGNGNGDDDAPPPEEASAATLEAEAQPGAVTLRWEETGADSYKLYVATEPECDVKNYGLCSDGKLITDVASPYTVEDLENGQSHWFYVESVVDGDTALSNLAGARPDSLLPNDSVHAITQDADGTTYLGGDFTRIGMRSGHGVIFDARTEAPGAFPLVNDDVRAATPDGNGGFFIGGDFTEVGGKPRQRLAHIGADGSLSDWNPGADDTVLALAEAEGIVYAGGKFSEVGNYPRDHLAAIDSEGNVTSWNPGAASNVEALAVLDDLVYVGGAFNRVDAAPRDRLAAIDFECARQSLVIRETEEVERMS